MELKSIDQIRSVKEELSGKIKTIDISNYNAKNYGPEQEYSIKGVIAGLESLLTDISALENNPEKFIQISTHAERVAIATGLTRINSYFETPQNYIPQFESLKVLVRGYNIRTNSDRQAEFINELGETRKIKIELQRDLEEVRKIRLLIDEEHSGIQNETEKITSKFEEIETQLESIIEKKNEITQESESLRDINSSLSLTEEKANQYLDEILNSTTISKSNEKLIESFAGKVQERDNKLTEIKQDTETVKQRLEDYEKERFLILEEANELINSAKLALNYKTAEGISASFQSQYNNSKKKIFTVSWIIAGAMCLGGTVWLGVWILETSPDQIGLLIGRISLLPLPIIGAIFCANQYVKQKNIIEDYAYKMVLSKAIVGFSEQLKENESTTNEEYIHYIKTVLEEIHRDPLRKRETNKKEIERESTSLKDLVEVAEKIVNMTKIEQ